MKFNLVVAALMSVAGPAVAADQTVREGIEAWQKGDHAAAIATWSPLAAKGDADAAFNLGQAYRLGKGVPTDLARAQQYLEQAARKDHVDAATTLGILMFQNGNRTGAMRWIKKAALAGEARAMLLYGTALYNGDGIPVDPVMAYAFVSRAAAQGLGAGRATLADLDEAMSLDQRTKGLALAKVMVSGAAEKVAAEKVAAGKVPAAKAPAVKVAAAAKPTIAPVAAKATAPPARSGAWRIQLGAFGKRSTAEALFARIQGKIGARQAYYVAAGAVTRLQVGPYDSRSAASAACAGLGGQACFAVNAR